MCSLLVKKIGKTIDSPSVEAAASTLRRAPWSRVYIIDLREFFPSEDSARVLLLEADGQTLLVGMDFLFTASAN